MAGMQAEIENLHRNLGEAQRRSAGSRELESREAQAQISAAVSKAIRQEQVGAP